METIKECYVVGIVIFPLHNYTISQIESFGKLTLLLWKNTKKLQKFKYLQDSFMIRILLQLRNSYFSIEHNSIQIYSLVHITIYCYEILYSIQYEILNYIFLFYPHLNFHEHVLYNSFLFIQMWKHLKPGNHKILDNLYFMIINYILQVATQL